MGDAEMSRLEDVVALRALVERYAQAVDAGDSSAFAAVFTPDGHLAADDGVTVTDFYGREQLAEIPERREGDRCYDDALPRESCCRDRGRFSDRRDLLRGESLACGSIESRHDGAIPRPVQPRALMASGLSWIDVSSSCGPRPTRLTRLVCRSRSPSGEPTEPRHIRHRSRRRAVRESVGGVHAVRASCSLIDCRSSTRCQERTHGGLPGTIRRAGRARDRRRFGHGTCDH